VTRHSEYTKAATDCAVEQLMRETAPSFAPIYARVETQQPFPAEA
jgi:hypothetical protein